MSKVDFNKVRRRLAILAAAGITTITGAKAQENQTPEKSDYEDKVETVTDSKDNKSSTDIVSSTSVVVTETLARQTGKNVYKKGDKIPEKRDVVEKQIKNRDRAEDIYFNRGTLSKNEYRPFLGKPCFVPYDSKLPVQEITNNKVPASAGYRLEKQNKLKEYDVYKRTTYIYDCVDNNENRIGISSIEFDNGVLFVPEGYNITGIDRYRKHNTLSMSYEQAIFVLKHVDKIPEKLFEKTVSKDGASISANTEKGKEQKKEDKKPKQPKSDMLTPEEIAIKKRYSRSK